MGGGEVVSCGVAIGGGPRRASNSVWAGTTRRRRPALAGRCGRPFQNDHGGKEAGAGQKQARKGRGEKQGGEVHGLAFRGFPRRPPDGTARGPHNPPFGGDLRLPASTLP